MRTFTLRIEPITMTVELTDEMLQWNAEQDTPYQYDEDLIAAWYDEHSELLPEFDISVVEDDEQSEVMNTPQF